MNGLAPLPVLPGIAEHWLDFARTLTSVFAGALLAFLANRHLQERARRREEKVAGHVAMATLMRQYNGYLQIRSTVQEQAAIVRRRYPDAPEWLLLSPVQHSLRKDLHFDFDSIGFIFEMDDDGVVFTSLHEIEQLYSSLVDILDEFAAAARERQRKTETAGIGPGSEVTVERVLMVIGPQTEMQLQSMYGAMLGHFELDDGKYLSASSLLHRILVRRFRTRFFRPTGAKGPPTVA